MRTRLFLLFIGILIAFGCTPKDAPTLSPPKVTVRDDLGRDVSVSRAVERVISLAPSVTEMVYAVGSGEKLVGVTTYCNFPDATKSIEKVGDTQTPDIERIIALRPDVILVSTDSQLQSFMQTLDERGIAVYVIQSNDVEDVFSDMVRLGTLLGTEAAAETVVKSLKSRVDALGGTSDSAPSKVFVQISREPLFTIGADSFITKLVEKAGGVSVTRDVPTGYPKLSKETAAASDPDVIILSDSEDNREPNDAFKKSKAFKNGSIYRIDADILSRPGPRMVDALEQMARMIGESKAEVK
jgi:ABC-type Fe3+-hydroxamate transport system substrate-binding protein